MFCLQSNLCHYRNFYQMVWIHVKKPNKLCQVTIGLLRILFRIMIRRRNWLALTTQLKILFYHLTLLNLQRIFLEFNPFGENLNIAIPILECLIIRCLWYKDFEPIWYGKEMCTSIRREQPLQSHSSHSLKASTRWWPGNAPFDASFCVA